MNNKNGKPLDIIDKDTHNKTKHGTWKLMFIVINPNLPWFFN